MRHRRVTDLMTPTAVSVQRGTGFKEIARLLDEYGITAVPVVDEDERPVGVVSEADLLRRQTSQTTGNTAEALMSSPAVVAQPHWSAIRAARVMEQHRIKRLPVVGGDGRLTGVISRSDLLQLFLRRDRSIQEEILEDVLTQTLGLSPSALTVDVTDGVVTLSGAVERSSLIPVTVRLCESVDGVVDVVDRLVSEVDDTGGTAAPRTAGRETAAGASAGPSGSALPRHSVLEPAPPVPLPEASPGNPPPSPADGPPPLGDAATTGGRWER